MRGACLSCKRNDRGNYLQGWILRIYSLHRNLKIPVPPPNPMEFCQKCGGMIVIKDDKASCAGCGAKSAKKPKIEASEKINNVESVAVIDEESGNTYPIVDMTCPECKNKKSYFWTTQTRASDESETKFYKCTKCRHTWRKYR